MSDNGLSEKRDFVTPKEIEQVREEQKGKDERFAALSAKCNALEARVEVLEQRYEWYHPLQHGKPCPPPAQVEDAIIERIDQNTAHIVALERAVLDAGIKIVYPSTPAPAQAEERCGYVNNIGAVCGDKADSLWHTESSLVGHAFISARCVPSCVLPFGHKEPHRGTRAPAKGPLDEPYAAHEAEMKKAFGFPAPAGEAGGEKWYAKHVGYGKNKIGPDKTHFRDCGCISADLDAERKQSREALNRVDRHEAEAVRRAEKAEADLDAEREKHGTGIYGCANQITVARIMADAQRARAVEAERTLAEARKDIDRTLKAAQAERDAALAREYGLRRLIEEAVATGDLPLHIQNGMEAALAPAKGEK